MISRRQLIGHVLKIGAVTGFALACTANSVFASEINDMSVSDEEFNAFMTLSKALTGFDDLDESIGKHFAIQQKNNKPEDWEAVLKLTSNTDLAPTRDLSETLKEQITRSEAHTELVRDITKFWYSGWLVPAPNIPTEIRASAYVGALAWQAMGIEPKGMPDGQFWGTV